MSTTVMLYNEKEKLAIVTFKVSKDDINEDIVNDIEKYDRYINLPETNQDIINYLQNEISIGHDYFDIFVSMFLGYYKGWQLVTEYDLPKGTRIIERF